MGAESAEQPAEQMSERHDHVKNVTETSRIQLCAKSFILQAYDVLARHTTAKFVLWLIIVLQDFCLQPLCMRAPRENMFKMVVGGQPGS